MTHQSTLDKWFMRGKDVILIAGPILALYILSVKFYMVPQEVEAHSAEIKVLQAQVVKLHEQDLSLSSDIRDIKTSQEYTNKGIDDLKSWMKTLSNRLASTR